MTKNPRQLAVEILNRVDRGAYAEPLVDKTLAGEDWDNIHDRSLLTEMVYGVLRMRGRLDWIIGFIYRGQLGKMDPGLKNIIRTGLYQILILDRIPDHAAVDESVRITEKMFPGRTGLVNAILRNTIRRSGDIAYPAFDKDPASHISIYHSHPIWLVKRWIAAFGTEETLKLCSANNEKAPLCIRINGIKATRESVMERLAQDGCEVRETAFSKDGIYIINISKPIRELDAYKKGYFQVQDEASQLTSRIVDPQGGEGILDICSGVGGKTTHLAALMRNCGSILAIDIQEDKLKLLKKLSIRLGISILEIRKGDATKDLGRDFQNRFDRILIDAPCTGLGTLRRNPEIKWRIHPEDIKKITEIQKKILDRSHNYLKPGGILVYSTCTIMPEENEDIVNDFLSRNRDYKSIPIAGSIPGALVDASGFFRTYPHRHGMDGFFAALLQREIVGKN